ncbi:unnamed protein product, partial [Meganyctiphanes norvegica]
VMMSDINSDEEINTTRGADDQAATSFSGEGNSLAAIAASLRALTHKIEDLKHTQRAATARGTSQDQQEGSWEEEVAAKKETAHALQSVLYSLHKFLPHVVKIKENKKIVGFSLSYSLRQIIVDINFEGSWLEKPEPANTSEKNGHWPISTQFPSSNKCFYPPDRNKKIPFAIPCTFLDPEIEKFLFAKSLNKGSKVSLNDVFDKPEFYLGKSKGATIHPILDSLARKAIIEGGISDTLLEAVGVIINTMLDEWERASSDLIEMKASLKEISKFLTLGRQTNWRCKNFIAALLVSNKLALRNYVLDNCSGSSTSKEIMKHSSFFTPFLFGEVPESLAKKVEGSSKTYWNHIIRTSRDTKKNNPNNKRKKSPLYHNVPKKVAQMNFNKHKREVSDFGKRDRNLRKQDYFARKQNKSKGKPVKKTVVDWQRLEDNMVTNIIKPHERGLHNKSKGKHVKKSVVDWQRLEDNMVTNIIRPHERAVHDVFLYTNPEHQEGPIIRPHERDLREVLMYPNPGHQEGPSIRPHERGVHEVLLYQDPGHREWPRHGSQWETRETNVGMETKEERRKWREKDNERGRGRENRRKEERLKRA